jgi:peptidoglycan/LPS O-acetylase OafA/YrhL
MCFSRRPALVRVGGLALVFLGLSCLAGGIAIWLPWLAIWIGGALAAQLARKSAVPRIPGPAGLAVLAAGLFVARLQIAPPVVTDLLVGFGTAIAIADRRLLAWCPFERPVRAGADFSYSLYLTHLPVAVLAGALLERFGWPSTLVPPGPSAYAAFAAMVLAVLAVAFLFAQATERHTGAVREFLLARERKADAPTPTLV